jgi:NTE family protein
MRSNSSYLPVRAKIFTALVSSVAVLQGCAAFNYIDKDAPIPATSISVFTTKPKIAVVLGSGGPRGYAHTGVIKVLEEAGIKPDLVVGTSVGALIGAFWADGKSAAEIEKVAFSSGPLTLFDLNPFADRGWIQGQKLQNYVNTQLSNKSIEALGKPMIVVATLRSAKTPVFFTRGNLGVAVRASSAVPGVISPVGISGTEYEDGDVSLPVAVSAARAAGAHFVIVVDVSAHEGTAPPGADLRWLAKDEKRRALIEPEVAQADFLIHPDMGYLASPSRAFFEKAFNAGELAARQRLSALQAKISALGHAQPKALSLSAVLARDPHATAIDPIENQQRVLP